jgi:hypothetical protein
MRQPGLVVMTESERKELISDLRHARYSGYMIEWLEKAADEIQRLAARCASAENGLYKLDPDGMHWTFFPEALEAAESRIQENPALKTLR